MITLDKNAGIFVATLFVFVVAYRGDLVLCRLIQDMKPNETFQSKEVKQRFVESVGVSPSLKGLFQHPIVTHLFRPLGAELGLAIAGVFTANVVTFVGVLLCLLAYFCLKSPNVSWRWVGLLLFIIRELLDCADGEVARQRLEMTRRRLASSVATSVTGAASSSAAPEPLVSERQQQIAYVLDGVADSVAAWVFGFACMAKWKSGWGFCNWKNARGDSASPPNDDLVRLESNANDDDESRESKNGTAKLLMEDSIEASTETPSSSSSPFQSAKEGRHSARQPRRSSLAAWEFGLFFFFHSVLYHRAMHPYAAAAAAASAVGAAGASAFTEMLQSVGFTMVFHAWAFVDPCIFFLFGALSICVDKEFQFCRFMSRRVFPFVCLLYAVSLIHIYKVESQFLRRT